MEQLLGVDGLYWLILAGIILLLIFLDMKIQIKLRHSALKLAGQICLFLLIVIGGAIIVIAIGYGAFWVYSWLGLAISILAGLIIIWAIADLLMKFKEKLLITILGAHLTAIIKSFLTGMSIFIKTPIGFITISLGSITWVGISDPNVGQIITIPLPAYIWATVGVIFSWGITSMIGSLVKTVKSSFSRSAKPTSEPKPAPRLKLASVPKPTSEPKPAPELKPASVPESTSEPTPHSEAK